MRQIKILRGFLALLTGMLPVLTCFGSAHAFSLEVSDYMTYDVSADFSADEVYAGDKFYASITGEATCIADLPFTVSSASIEGTVVARHRTSGHEVVLNSSYSVEISPFPSDEGDQLEKSIDVTLKFPSSSKAGVYDVYAKLVEAIIYYNFLGSHDYDVTDLLPSEEKIGSITVLEDEEQGGGGIVINPDDLSGYIDTNGKFLQDITFESNDKDCRLNIVQGTIATLNGDAIDGVTIDVLTTPPALPQSGLIEFAGRVYDFGPDGATFDPEVTLTLSYDPALLPDGLPEQRLYVAMWDDTTDKWVAIESTVDTESATVTAQISHFTPFAILVPSSPAQFGASNLVISPTQVQAGETVTITLILSNSGDLPGNRTVSLKINNVEMSARKIPLAGGVSQTLSFEIATIGYAPGIYSVEAEGLTGSFTVYEAGQLLTPPETGSPVPNVSPLPPSTPTSQSTSHVNLPALGLVIVGVIAAAIFISILAQHKQ